MLHQYAEFHNLILAAVIVMARIGGAFFICPAMSEAMIPGLARKAAVLALSSFMVPSVMEAMPAGDMGALFVFLLMLKEIFIGLLIGFCAAVPFWVAEGIGNFIDNQRGATMGEVYSPLNGAQVSVFGILFTQIASTVFFAGGAVFVFLGVLYESYRIYPVFGCSFSFAEGAAFSAISTLGSLVQTILVLAAPAVIVMFLATLGLGLVNRTAPQLNVFFLSMPVKSAIGIAILVAYLPYVLDVFIRTNEGDILSGVGEIIKGL
ncbi:MAG: type III secretion system export apparatus subunit SctT [Kiritimatiellae bacterium]|nr:type III secretion system export apparatus subunit SctT [Kiritimatiellia bacterium]